MNTTVKNILIFAMGAGLGSIVTYKLLKDEYEQIAQEEIDSVMDTFKRYNPANEPEEMSDEEYERLNYKRKKGEYTAYDKIGRPAEADEIETLPAYVISVVDYNENNLHYEKSSLTYYDVDDTLVDENEEPITDPDYVVGLDALTRFGDGSDDDDIVYIRNEKLAVDYEIVRVDKSYQETILGIIDLPIRKKGKHVKREESDRE